MLSVRRSENKPKMPMSAPMNQVAACALNESNSFSMVSLPTLPIIFRNRYDLRDEASSSGARTNPGQIALDSCHLVGIGKSKYYPVYRYTRPNEQHIISVRCQHPGRMSPAPSAA